MNYSLSTSWNSKSHKNGYDLIREIKAIGFDTVELNFALTEAVVENVLALKEKGEIKVSSLHNMCPLPPEIDPSKASPDYYSLASLGEDERKMAVAIAKNTMDYAKRFGADAIVLHAGRVQIKDRMRDLAAMSGDKIRFEALRSDMINERKANSAGCVDSLIKSLDELVPYAAKTGVRIGLENRYYYREMPLVDEFEIVFKNFKPGSLYYWHDVGHAEVFERLGFYTHKELLEKFSSRLIGVHLHDIIGYINDHKAPGRGTFDFGLIKPYIRKDLIKVLEIHRPATPDEIRRGAEYLDKILG